MRWTQLRDLVEAEINSLIVRELWDEQERMQLREKTAIELQLRYGQYMASTRGGLTE